MALAHNIGSLTILTKQSILNNFLSFISVAPYLHNFSYISFTTTTLFEVE